MLQHLYIRDFAIVHQLEIALDSGFSVLTGETGAGKSILIDALALALGERAESAVIRHGSDRAEVAAGFDLNPDQDAARWLREHDLFDDGECLLRRVVERDKGSKAWINGRPVPVQSLREFGELLVDIHGQHEHQSLLKREAQREILDGYAGLTETVETLATHYQQWKSLEDRLQALRHQSADREARVELLRYQVKELDALALEAGEVPVLEEEHARLTNGAELLEGVQAVAQSVYDDDENSVARQLTRAVGKLDSLSQYDPKLGEITALLNEAAIQVDEAGSRLHHYLDNLELDPERLQAVERRLSSVHDLSRKHKVRAEELPAVHEHLRTELNDIEDLDTNLGKLEEDIRQEREAYLKAAKEVTRRRETAARKLARAVTSEMQELGMPGGNFDVTLAPLSEGEASAHGNERVEFQVSANAGQPAKPLNKVASGGELSRISLALQVVIAGLGSVPTMIFDEVDVGIGGRVAEIVGQKLRALGKSRQVLCITHLAQVAAQGERHLAVSKRVEGKITLAEVRPLIERERTLEIARMIGGVEISKQTLAHAKDMLSRASA